MTEIIKTIQEYLRYFPNDPYAREHLLLYEYANELGMELKGTYYPRIEHGRFKINSQISVSKQYSLSNSTTKYKHNGQDSIVRWEEYCGRLAFVSDRYWEAIEEEWNEFMDVLKSYEPLDYDELNSVYIYDIPHGKRLIDDYEDIVATFKSKVEKKVKEYRKQELKNMLKELDDEEE